MSKKRTLAILFILFLWLVLPFLPAETVWARQEASYQIGPNDVLSIFVWKEKDLTQELTVMPDGSISFPLIGEIKAQGKTVTALKTTLEEKLKK